MAWQEFYNNRLPRKHKTYDTNLEGSNTKREVEIKEEVEVF
jgi:hypothetical protein